MSAGHLAMAFDQAFLAALLLLVIGSGFLKGNISTQVGALYPREEEARRCRGYVIFSTAINIGAVLGPLLCGLVAQLYGWHYGFGVAAVFMMLGLATYLSGYRHLPARVGRRGAASERLSRTDWRTIGAIVAVIVITIFQSTSYYQIFNVGPVWIQQHVAPNIGRFHVPVPWYQAVHSLFSVLTVVPLLWLWRRQASRGHEPGDLLKIGIGAGLAAVANLVLVISIYVADGASIHPFWPLLYCFVLAIGFLHYWPTLLALVSCAAPAKVNATMMGVAFLSLFISNNLIGWIAGFYERLGPSRFWALHAAIAAAGAVLVMLFGRKLSRALQAR